MRLQTLRQKKKYFYTFSLVFALIFALSPASFAAESRSWRKLLNPFHLNLAAGYGSSFYKNSIADMYMYEQDGKHYLIFPRQDPYIRYLVSGISEPYIRLKTYEPITIDNLQTQAKKLIKYTGRGYIFPFSLSIHVDVLKKLRIELGSSLLINRVSTFNFDQANAPLDHLQDALGRYYKIRYFARLGFKLYESKTYTLLFNTQNSYDFGYTNLSDATPIYKSFFATIGIGLTSETHISEYFTVFSCLMYEIGNSLNTFPQQEGSILLNQQAFYWQFGMHFNCPEIPPCPLKHCKIAYKHKHDNKPYRGQSIFKGEKEPK